MVVGRAEGGEDRRTHLIERFRMPSPSRRDVLVVSAGAALAGLAPKAALAQDKDKAEAHGISAFGDLRYPADFKHFDYVNPNAPKGGMLSQLGATRQFNQNFITFNSLNTFILKGDACAGHGADIAVADDARL